MFANGNCLMEQEEFIKSQGGKLYPNTESERHRVFVEFAEIISSQYDLPHVDEVEQEKLEREYEMRDEVYPDED